MTTSDPGQLSHEGAARAGGGERERSTISFPYGDMESAIKIANGIRDVGGTSCQWEQLGAALGMAPKGGGFRVMVSTARVFDLVAYDKKSVWLTELGSRACDPAQVAKAKAEAFLKVPLYERLFERFKATTLPPDQALESEMATLGVARKQTRKARQAFQRSAEQAGFFMFGKDRIVMPSTANSGDAPPSNTGNGQAIDDGRTKSGNRDGGEHDFINGLVRKLPEEGTEWPMESRCTWLQAANAIFELLYGRPETEGKLRIEIRGERPETSAG